jgi:hypothetical protein
MTDWQPPAGLERALKQQFGATAYVVDDAPQVTGIRLWKLTRGVEEYPVMPRAERDLLVPLGQGRWEATPAVPGPTIPAVYAYDMMWAYVACCTGLVRGAMIHDDEPLFDATVRGFYKVRFTVPADWRHLGILRVNSDDGITRHAPTSGTHVCWCGWTEALLAREMGWRVEVLERIIWSGQGRAPLDTWRHKLMAIAAQHPDYAPAVRTIIIQTIGQFAARNGREVTHTVSNRALIPPDRTITARPVDPRDREGAWQYAFRLPLRPELAAVRHPEWAADVWARCRTRVLRYQQKGGRGTVLRETGALTVPREHVLAIRQDALLLSARPAWESGSIGDFREVAFLPGPLPAPRTGDDIERLRQAIVARSQSA